MYDSLSYSLHCVSACSQMVQTFFFWVLGQNTPRMLQTLQSLLDAGNIITSPAHVHFLPASLLACSIVPALVTSALHACQVAVRH